jgi:DNA polymerase-3 subunit delta
MAAPGAKSSSPLVLVCGDDNFAVSQRARQLYEGWSKELGGTDHEVIDAQAANSNEALKAVGRLRESLYTLPFFGTGKAVWFKNCNFLADERMASAQSVTEALTDLGTDLKAFSWTEPVKVCLVISSTAVDKRKSFYKTLDKIGKVEALHTLSIEDKDWADSADQIARKRLAVLGKSAEEEALAELIARVGPNQQQLESELEKICLYIGNRPTITLKDVSAVTIRNKNARAFAVGDALGDRKLPILLKRLDEELWEVKLDSKKSEIGLLYGLISKVRSMLLMKEVVREGHMKRGSDYNRFKADLDRIPQDQMPNDKRFNPKAIHPFVLFRSYNQMNNYTQEELLRAMELLFQANRQLVSSGMDESLVLQQTIIQIASGGPSAPGQPSKSPAGMVRSLAS